jgi:hypothetical protein
MTVKKYWRVSPKPVGRYRSFESRSWPSADYSDGRVCARIACDDDYTPNAAKTGKHKPLILRIANYAHTPWQWVRAKQEFATLAEAKAALDRILETAPSLMPKEYQP